MPRKFVYGPGLPGYGTKGVDGSTGLLGLATYFSAYDGNSDSVTIKSKIIANKELFSNENLLPGYPARTYQSGDIFIDKNARVFQIDFGTANLYVDTGIFLNTSGFFTELGAQINPPQFTRYSNSYSTEKFLIDVVYSNNAGNYTSYPTSIYDNAPNYFAQVKYVGTDLVPNFNGWYPFQVWTTGIPGYDDAIALVREENNNTWHFGNADGGVTKDVSLYLDFGDIYTDGVFHGTIDGTITTTNLFVPGWLTVGGDASFNDVYIGGTLYGGSPIDVADTIDINSGQIYLYNTGGITAAGNVTTTGTGASNGFGTGEASLYTTGTISYLDHHGAGSFYIQTQDKPSTTENLYIRTGTNTSTLGGNAGHLFLNGGNGAGDSAGSAGDGGYIQMTPGAGGDYSGGATSYGGDTGWFRFVGSNAGNASGTGYGGRAGRWEPAYSSGMYQFQIDLGDGGSGVYANGGLSTETNYGGGFRVQGGQGGSGTSSSGSGKGGKLFMRSGQGGHSSHSSGNAGDGGFAYYLSNGGGNYTHLTGTGNGGAGGPLYLFAGGGGPSSSSSGSSSGGNGGEIAIYTGSGGAATGGPDGDGGDMVLNMGTGNTDGVIRMNLNGQSAAATYPISAKGDFNNYLAYFDNVYNTVAGKGMMVKAGLGSAGTPATIMGFGDYNSVFAADQGSIQHDGGGVRYMGRKLQLDLPNQVGTGGTVVSTALEAITIYTPYVSGNAYLQFFDVGTTDRGGIYYDGFDFKFWDTSDERLKENIKPVELNALDVVNNVHLKEWTWKKDDDKPLEERNKIQGYIAQELLDVYPLAVVIPEDPSEMYGVAKAAFIPVLMKAVQEQQVIIDELKAKDAEMQNILSELISRVEALENV